MLRSCISRRCATRSLSKVHYGKETTHRYRRHIRKPLSKVMIASTLFNVSPSTHRFPHPSVFSKHKLGRHSMQKTPVKGNVLAHRGVADESLAGKGFGWTGGSGHRNDLLVHLNRHVAAAAVCVCQFKRMGWFSKRTHRGVQRTRTHRTMINTVAMCSIWKSPHPNTVTYTWQEKLQNNQNFYIALCSLWCSFWICHD